MSERISLKCSDFASLDIQTAKTNKYTLDVRPTNLFFPCSSPIPTPAAVEIQPTAAQLPGEIEP